MILVCKALLNGCQKNMPRPLTATLLLAMCQVFTRVILFPPPLQAIYIALHRFKFQNVKATTFYLSTIYIKFKFAICSVITITRR